MHRLAATRWIGVFILLDRTRGVEEIINFGMFPFGQRDATALKIAFVRDECACMRSAA